LIVMNPYMGDGDKRTSGCMEGVVIGVSFI
jgi:hypothetical protein